MSEFPMLKKDNGADDEVYYDTIPLPSKGMLYPEDHPLHNCETVDVKQMTAPEENILASPGLLKKGTVVNVLMKSCLLNKAIDPSSLLIGDKSAILIAIRVSGFTEDYRVRTSCRDCGHEFDHTFKLDKLKIKRLGDGLPTGEAPVVVGPNLFSFTLPKSKKVVQFSLLTDAEDVEISKTQENRRKALKAQGVSNDIDTSITDRLAKCIKKFGDQTEPSKITQMVGRMLAIDSKALRHHIVSIEPDVVMEQEVECPKCSENTTHPIPMGLEFFWPQR